MNNTKEKVLHKLSVAEQAIKESRDLLIDEMSTVEKFKSALSEVGSFLGLTNPEPTINEVKEKIDEKIDTATDAAVEKTVDEVIKSTETKAEEVKAATADEGAKSTATKVKDAVVTDVKENVKAKKEAIKAEAKKLS